MADHGPHRPDPPERCAARQPSDDLALGSREAEERPRAPSASAGGWRTARATRRHAAAPRRSSLVTDPSAPAAARSDRRCSTSTWAMPRARASLNPDCSHLAAPSSLRSDPRLVEDEDRARRARLAPGGLEGRGGAAQDDRQRPGADRAETSSTTTSPASSTPGDVAPVEHAAQLAVDEPAQLERREPPFGGERGRRGPERARRVEARREQVRDDAAQRRAAALSVRVDRSATSSAARSGGARRRSRLAAVGRRAGRRGRGRRARRRAGSAGRGRRARA